MFKKTIEFEDFNGNKKSKDFYFHLSKAELLEMGVSDMQARIRRIIESKDGVGILNELKQFIRMSVGIRSEDGERFVKDADAQSELLDSPAYDELLMQLATNANASVEFITNLVPEKMQQEMKKKMTELSNSTPESVSDSFKDNRPAYLRENRAPTQAELVEMDQGTLKEALDWIKKNTL